MIEAALATLESTQKTLPGWMVPAVAVTLAVVLGLGLHSLLFRLLTRAVSGLDLFWHSLVSRSRGPTRLGAVMLALMTVPSIVPLGDWPRQTLRHVLLIGLIVLIAWIASRALHIWTTVHLRRFRLDTDDNLFARKHVTQTRILRRVVDTLIVVVAIGAVLMTFESVRQYGVSLLASAGAAGIILGLALQTVLKNLFAGIQLALTQPIRLDDVIIVEGEWGKVEEVTATYVVVKIWDWRRMIVPLSYFIERPFQNWTREGASIIGVVKMYLDYTVPVEAIRAKARDVAEGSELWDGEVFAVQVTDFTETAMEVRVIASARDAGQAFDLRCLIREKLIAFLQAEHPQSLPSTRVRMEQDEKAPENGRPSPTSDGATSPAP